MPAFENLKVITLEPYQIPQIEKPPGENWYILGMEGENILRLSGPRIIIAPLSQLKIPLEENIQALIDVHLCEEGCPPARIIQFIRPFDQAIGLAVGGRVQTPPFLA